MPNILNIFRNDAFSTVELTGFIDRYPYKPSGLGDLGLFEDLPIRTTALAVEDRQGVLRVVPTSARGAPPVERLTEKRKARYFEVPRLAHGDTINASELQNIRPFIGDNGQEVTVLMQVQDEVARRLSGPTGLQANMETTWELHRLGAVQGKLLDVDGTVLYDWFAEFGIAPPAEYVFPFGPASGVKAADEVLGPVRVMCNKIVRDIMRAAQGAWTPQTRIQAIVGDEFFDRLIASPDVARTYLNWNEAQELRKGTAFASFPFGGIDWMNYRGSNDNSTIAVPSDKAKFFPVNAPGVFQVAWAPYESVEWVNQPGKPLYVQPIVDRDRGWWWRDEVYSYPLHICTRPEMLRSARIA